MYRPRHLPLLILALCVVGPALGADGCAGFNWNVQHERALFATSPSMLAAGRDLATAPVVTPDHLYEATLFSQDQITYAIAPVKTTVGGASGGLVRLAIAASGTYRISVDQSAWIDIADNGALLASKDHQGRPDCTAPHKIVEFELTTGAQLTLQFSGATGSKALFAITLAPTEPTPATSAP
jgi:hypothetical protein